MERELDQMRQWIEEAKKGEGLTVKRLEAALLRAEERLRARLDSTKDPGITFEATGVETIQRWNEVRADQRLPYVIVAVDEVVAQNDPRAQFRRHRDGLDAGVGNLATNKRSILCSREPQIRRELTASQQMTAVLLALHPRANTILAHFHTFLV